MTAVVLIRDGKSYCLWDFGIYQQLVECAGIIACGSCRRYNELKRSSPNITGVLGYLTHVRVKDGGAVQQIELR